MKIAKTDTPGFDCFIILSDGLLPKAERLAIEKKIFENHGKVTVYNTSSKTKEKDIWTTNKYGLENDRHDSFKDIDFEFVLFKNPEFYT